MSAGYNQLSDVRDSRMWLVNGYPPCLEMESSCGVPASYQSYILGNRN